MNLEEFKEKTKNMNMEDFSYYVFKEFNVRVPLPCAYISSDYGVFSIAYEKFIRNLKKALKE